MIQGLRLQRISQTWLCSRGFLSIYNLSQSRMRRAITSVCTALRAQTLGGHVTPSITMDASFCCCWLQGFSPGYRGPGEPPGLIYLPTWPGHGKNYTESIQDYYPGPGFSGSSPVEWLPRSKRDDFRIYSDFASNSILCLSVVILLCVCQLVRIVCSFTDTWKRHWVTLLRHVQMCTQISIRNHCFLFIGISRLWE